MVGQGEEKKQGHSELVKSEKKKYVNLSHIRSRSLERKLKAFPRK